MIIFILYILIGFIVALRTKYEERTVILFGLTALAWPGVLLSKILFYRF